MNEGYTYAHIWHALRHDRNFDYAFYAEVFLILTSRHTIRAFSKLLVPLATLLILALTYLGVFVVTPAIENNYRGVLMYFNGLVVPFLLFKMLYNYFCTVLISPGYTDAIVGLQSHPVCTGDNTCKKCQLVKPPRAHHCSLCNKCTLRMDHHCPFVNNCVGLHNYGYFVSFLFWTALSTAYLSVLCVAVLLQYHSVLDYYRMAVAMSISELFSGDDGKALTAVQVFPVGAINGLLFTSLKTQRLVVAVTLAVANTIAAALSLLSGFHAFLVLSGQTTLEYMRRNNLNMILKLRKENRVVLNEYDEGFRTNYRQVFGTEVPRVVSALLDRWRPQAAQEHGPRSLQDAFTYYAPPEDDSRGDSIV